MNSEMVVRNRINGALIMYVKKNMYFLMGKEGEGNESK